MINILLYRARIGQFSQKVHSKSSRQSRLKVDNIMTRRFSFSNCMLTQIYAKLSPSWAVLFVLFCLLGICFEQILQENDIIETRSFKQGLFIKKDTKVTEYKYVSHSQLTVNFYARYVNGNINPN